MQPQARNVKVAPLDSYGAYINRWAIIVGVSQYKHQHLNLKYADRDAEELYKLLQTPSGGGFETNKIIKLVNEDATTANITRALRSFLKKPAKEDIVLLYFACHGSPDLDRPSIVYLMTHDTDPEDISGTALPMREIDLSLKENLNAERVVIIADTCHSAAIGGTIGRRGAGNDAQAINTYLQEVSKAKGGVALLTSAEANESAQESEQWGGGHGVFTHFLLQGMRGDADGYGQPKDGVVTVGELFDYVRESVKKATNNQQHPAIGTNPFDRNLPMAITGGNNAQEHYKLGLYLYELGWMLDDIKRFQAAAEQFSEAIHLSQMAKTPFPEAELGLGRAQVALGDYSGAIRVLSRFIEKDGLTKAPSEALFYLGIAQTKKRDYSAATSTFEKFLAHYPEDENAAWVGDYIRWLKSNTGGQKYALLIGINQYTSQMIPPLNGCVNDVQFMNKVLTQRYGFEETNVFTLLDQKATRQGILSALETLSQKATTADMVIVHYSGHSIPESHRDAFGFKPDHDLYLVVHDTVVHDTIDKSGYHSNGISPAELHRLMNAIPAVNKTLILDTHPSSQFIELAEKEGSYTLLLATDSAEISYELTLKIEGKNLLTGLFTGVLTQQFEESDPETLTYGELLDNAISKIKTLGYNQTPLLIGDREQLVFTREDTYLNFFEFGQRRNYSSLTSESIGKLYSKYRTHVASQFAQAHYSFGRAFLEKGNYSAAIDALQTAMKKRNGNYPEAALALCKVLVSGGRYAEALTTFRRYTATAPDEMSVPVQVLIERIEKLAHSRKHALLIGVNDYINPEVTRVQGAVNDVLALKEVLLTKFSFQEKDIKVLLNDDATRVAILEAFKQLAEAAYEEPELFYFAGNGSVNADNAPTIISTDGRQEQIFDIEIGKLAELANKNASNLVVILDAGCTQYSKAVNGSRAIPADMRERQATRDISRDIRLPIPDNVRFEKFRIGFLSIYPRSIQSGIQTIEIEADSKSKTIKPGAKGKFLGILTQALVQNLAKVDESNLTYSQWLASVYKQLELEAPVVLSDNLNELVFDSRTLRSEVLELVTKLEQEPVFETIRLLLRMIERREQQGDFYPERHLNLGLAYSAVGEYSKSIQALVRVVSLYTDPTIMAYEKEKDPNAEDHYREAHYQLGRILFESKNDFSRAVSELEEATRLDPENARAYYYLGQAIRAMVDRETLAKAEKALQTYLEKGAPLGNEDEVRKFLGSRVKNTQQGDKDKMQGFIGNSEQEATR